MFPALETLAARNLLLDVVMKVMKGYDWHAEPQAEDGLVLDYDLKLVQCPIVQCRADKKATLGN